DCLSSPDRDRCGTCQLAPEITRAWMIVAPLLNVASDLVFAATVVADDLVPRPDCPSKIERQFDALPELALDRADFAVRVVLPQNETGEDDVEVERPVTGFVVALEAF